MTTTLSEEQNAIFTEAVISLSELSGNNPEITISTEDVFDLFSPLSTFTHFPSEENEKKVYNNTMESSTTFSKVRKAPISIKYCNICNNNFRVAAPQKKCKDVNCNGELAVQPKEPKILKRAPPMCSKFCVMCDKIVENILTAYKKCTHCDSILTKMKKKEHVTSVSVDTI